MAPPAERAKGPKRSLDQTPVWSGLEGGRWRSRDVLAFEGLAEAVQCLQSMAVAARIEVRVVGSGHRITPARKRRWMVDTHSGPGFGADGRGQTALVVESAERQTPWGNAGLRW